VRDLQTCYDVSERRACRALPAPRSTVRYQSVAEDQAALRIRLKDLAATRVRYGYRRLHILLRREGWLINHKRVYRLYVEENLTMRTKKPRRHVSSGNRLERTPAGYPNQRWSMDFMSDELFHGGRIRILTIVDDFTRESLAIEASQRFQGKDVADVLDRIVRERGKPKAIRLDNGPEFTSKALDQWAYWNKVELAFSRPGKPTDNAFIESFNGKLRTECLNENWFLSLHDARNRLKAWQRDYNESRPHSALGNLAPSEYAVLRQKTRTA
jgi:putative transposase